MPSDGTLCCTWASPLSTLGQCRVRTVCSRSLATVWRVACGVRCCRHESHKGRLCPYELRTAATAFAHQLATAAVVAPGPGPARGSPHGGSTKGGAGQGAERDSLEDIVQRELKGDRVGAAPAHSSSSAGNGRYPARALAGVWLNDRLLGRHREPAELVMKLRGQREPWRVPSEPQAQPTSSQARPIPWQVSPHFALWSTLRGTFLAGKGGALGLLSPSVSPRDNSREQHTSKLGTCTHRLYGPHRMGLRDWGRPGALQPGRSHA